MTEASEEPSEAIVVECDLPDAPEKVWRALTERELLAAWLMPNDFRPELGAEFSLQPPSELEGKAIACKVLALEPPRLLRFSWQEAGAHEPGSLSFELAPTRAGGTRLVLIHRRSAEQHKEEPRAAQAAHAGQPAVLEERVGQLLHFPARVRGTGSTPPECLRCAA